MAHETRRPNERAIEALDVAHGDHVLDVGCGPGRTLAELAVRAPDGRVVGADPSELMAKIADQRNRALVKAGRVKVVLAGAAALPFADGAFDKALCVHVIYFWSDLRSNFREIARVLKPGGRLALLFRSTEDKAAVKAFPAEVYRFHDAAEVRAALAAEGFEVDAGQEAGQEMGTREAGSQPLPNLLLATRIAG
jgi:ubiquinone/menaquinone biosynthesis C-methylase UbiE